MKKFFFLLPVTLSVLLLSFAAVNAESRTVPKLYAVNFYADWCGNCKRLDPEFEKALHNGGWNSSEVKFVTLDLTNKVRIGQSVQKAKAEGVYSALKANGAKTGSIALLNGSTKQEVARFYAGDSAEKIQKIITAKLAL